MFFFNVAKKLFFLLFEHAMYIFIYTIIYTYIMENNVYGVYIYIIISDIS